MDETRIRTALVTGASSGLGAHFARVLAGGGYRVLLAAQVAARRMKDTALYRYARLVDGADEVYKMVLNNHLGAESSEFWMWDAGGRA